MSIPLSLTLLDIINDNSRHLAGYLSESTRQGVTLWGNVSAFGNFITEYITEEYSKGPISTVNRRDRPWEKLGIDLASEIASYLNVNELCMFAAVDRFSRDVFRYLASEGSGYWKRALQQHFSGWSVERQPLSIVSFVSCHLSTLQTELKHIQSAHQCYNALHEYYIRCKGSGVIGLVCDIAWVEDSLLAVVLSRKRYMTMLTVLTERESDVHRFKKTVTSYGLRSFLPVQVSARIEDDLDLQRIQRNDLTVDGFISWAVNIIQLRKEHEYMRYTVFWGLFRDLMVFKTRADAIRYSTTLSVEEINKFWCVTLEDYTQEVLDTTFPRFSCRKPRASMYQRSYYDIVKFYEKQINVTTASHVIATYTY
eukprot:CAMPEP_0185018892 /NCGR_PEP_ID=MMETSP1103-20130426/1568_1 /TAXON_ID=36769 /ORGANISM="Paraphysomonas bandaiensis, Strain Caron Lab Isolate" /LENGTH=366 /DNA_ID=CAMNT_0027548933 /DNA_START=8 /DNA_END=1108 /DNA_ORIENTATION=-